MLISVDRINGFKVLWTNKTIIPIPTKQFTIRPMYPNVFIILDSYRIIEMKVWNIYYPIPVAYPLL